MMRKVAQVACVALVLAACGDDKDAGDSGSTTPTSTGGTATGGGTGTGGGTAEASWNLSGTAIDFVTQAPVAEGLCVSLLDPSPVLTGGELEVLAETTTGAGGSIELADITTTSTVGLLLAVEDCAEEGTVFASATGVPFEDYDALGAGETLADFTALSVDAASRDTYQAGLGAQGYAGDLMIDGLVIGFVVDSVGTPIDGAVVTFTGTAPVELYYFNGVDFSGTSTTAAAGALVFMPAAPIGGYACEAPGYTFGGEITGVQPGYALFARFDSIE